MSNSIGQFNTREAATFNPLAPELLSEILLTANMVALIRLPDSSFSVIGTAPSWLVRLGSETWDQRILFTTPGTFMENFLIDADEFWRGSEIDRIRSGKWIETDANGNEYVYEATATRWQDKPVLFVQLVPDTYNEVRSIIQSARSTMLASDKLENMAYKDELTGLYNRRGFKLFAYKQWLLAKRNQSPLLVFSIDLDGLKSINDSLGHETGDQALIEVGEILRQVFRETDIVARRGGDEFTALAVNADASKAKTLQERMQSALDTRNSADGQRYRLSFSTGVAVYDARKKEIVLDTLLHEADLKMYKNKRNRKSSN